MNDYSIRAVGLGKQYRLAQLTQRRARYETLRDVLASAVARPLRRAADLLRRRAAGQPDQEATFWALRDVGFEVKAGEVVGIIGRNGAGKSTLLKILSRITEPSAGYAEIRGRVGSLLEVGTGFHPELTGRENVFLNGSILGMRRREIARKFDEIVAFAEVEKFIDTPVKHYSSGMHMRLAFAVAAHLEPEILLVDEVLAVGDSAFQKKCLNKMEDVGQQGRTILFVSHSMPAITRLCPRTLLLDGGRVLRDGPSHEVVGVYMSSGLGTTAAREWPDPAQAPGNDVVRLRAVRVRLQDGRTTEAIDIREPIGLEMEYDVRQPGTALWPCLNVRNEDGAVVFTAIDLDAEWRGRPRPTGRYVSTAWIPGNLLAEGMFIVSVYMRTIHPSALHFHERDAVAFQVMDTPDGTTARGDWAGHMLGVIRPVLKWETRYQANGQRHTPAPTGRP